MNVKVCLICELEYRPILLFILVIKLKHAHTYALDWINANDLIILLHVTKEEFGVVKHSDLRLILSVMKSKQKWSNDKLINEPNNHP